jgi:hypothetical protein
LDALKNLSQKSVANLLEARYNKFRKIGVFTEGVQTEEADTALVEGIPVVEDLPQTEVVVSTEDARLDQ